MGVGRLGREPGSLHLLGSGPVGSGPEVNATSLGLVAFQEG